MRTSAKTFTVVEYEGFKRGGSSVPGYQALPENTFDALEKFILFTTSSGGTEALELMSLSAKRDLGKTITARNHVGLIAMKDGTVIEILPKIHQRENISIDKTKRVFLDMLRSLRTIEFKDFKTANLETERLDLLEIFISMFISEITLITKQGLKSSYITVENNERFFKGKLIIALDINHNLTNRGRFFVRYDEFNVNRPENRLIKAALIYLHQQTRDDNNKRNLSILLTFFNGVDKSINHEAEFSKCISDRGMSHYKRALSWCMVFLRGFSFSAFSGSEVALALLFPMEKVFESFVAQKFRKHIDNAFEILIQDSHFSLFDSPASFALRPDIVLSSSKCCIVLDTKWKLLSKDTFLLGISQSDMYQMYAYCKKYDAEKVILLYPYADGMPEDETRFLSDDGATVEVSFIDLTQPDKSITRIINEAIIPSLVK